MMRECICVWGVHMCGGGAGESKSCSCCRGCFGTVADKIPKCLVKFEIIIRTEMLQKTAPLGTAIRFSY